MINAGAWYVDMAVVVDGNLVTSRVPSDLPEFATAMMEAFRNPNSCKLHDPGRNFSRKNASSLPPLKVS